MIGLELFGVFLIGCLIVTMMRMSRIDFTSKHSRNIEEQDVQENS